MGLRALCASALVTMSVSVHADSTYIEPGTEGAWSTPPAPAAPHAELHWYGYQLLGADAVAAVCVGVGASNPPWGGTAVEILGASLYSLGGVLVHGLHGHPVRAVASAGLRIGLPFVGGLLGFAYGAPRTPGLAGLGGAAGVLGAVLIDDMILSFERTAELSGLTPAPPRRAAFAISPTFAVVPDRQQGARATVGVVGQF